MALGLGTVEYVQGSNVVPTDSPGIIDLYVDTADNKLYGRNDTTLFDFMVLGSEAVRMPAAVGTDCMACFANDDTGTGTTDAIEGNITVTDGDETGIVRGIVGVAIADVDGDVAEIYGVYGLAQQLDGSDIATNIIGVFGYVDIDETTEADTANGIVAGVVGRYETTGVDPIVAFSAGFKAAVGAVIDGNANTVPHAGVMAYLETGGGGTSIPAAFKAVNRGADPTDGFDYGIDFTGADSDGATILLADIRGDQGDTIGNLVAKTWTFDAAIVTVIADAANVVAASFTQNDTTNDGNVINLINAGDGIGVSIDQNGIGAAISIDHDDTGAGASVIIDRDGNNAGDIIGLRIDVANAGAGDEIAIEVLGGASGITDAGNAGFVSDNNGTLTLVGFLRIQDDAGVPYYIPYGDIA